MSGRRSLPAADSLADLDRARWLLMAAKAESADALWRSREARFWSLCSLAFCLLSLGFLVVCALLVLNRAL